MKYVERAVVGLFATFAALALIWYFVIGMTMLFDSHGWTRLSASDWGTWVGGIGTVATLAMTIWLATDASRTRRTEQLNLALITAAEFKVRLRNTIRALAIAREALETPLAQGDDARVSWASHSARIDDGDLWKADELVPLVYMPNQVAARLARIGASVRTIKAIFKKVSDDDDLPDWDAANFVAGTLIYELNMNLAEIQGVMVECTDFLLAHGFHAAHPTYRPEYNMNRG